MRETILRIVNSKQGIKGVDLVLDIMSEVGPTLFKHDEYVQCVESLVQEKEIVEIEYIMPKLNFRVKSLYFPKGTTVKVNV